MNLKLLVLSILSAVLLVFAFPLFNCAYLAWFAFIPLLFIIRVENGKNAFFYGLLSGFIFFLGLLYWLVGTMMRFGSLPFWLSMCALLLLCLYLAFYFALFSIIVSYLTDNLSINISIIAPIVWVSLELIRSYLFSGFPWGVVGYSQAKMLRIIQIADVTGVYGLSFLVLFVNALLTEIVLNLDSKDKGGQRFQMIAKNIIVLALVFFFVLLYGDYRVRSLKEVLPKGDRLKITLLQGNIPQDIKRDITKVHKVLEIYGDLSLSTACGNSASHMIIWPETAYNAIVIPNIGENFFLLSEWARKIGCNLLLGCLREDRDNGGVYNSAILFSPTGTLVAFYDKIHLVPFGEYFPIHWIGERLVNLGSFDSGDDMTVFNVNGVPFSTLICFEAIFPHLCRRFVKSGAGFFVNITNDAWFGRTAAPYQHFDMVRLRTVENRVWLVRSANTGICAFITPYGEVIGEGGIFERLVLDGDIDVVSIKSPYVMIGDLFAIICTLISLFLCLLLIIKIRKGELR